MPKFFVKTNQIEENKIKIIGEDVKHINQVLRAKIGEELTICNLDTTLNYITTISQITPEYVMCDIQDCVKSFVESNVQVTIFQGLPKADKMEYIIQKNTELGAKQIVPVEMVRCVVKLDSKKEGKKIERWQKIAESAAKQSGRDLIPTVEMPIDINNLCEKIKEFDAVILAYEEEKENTKNKNHKENAHDHKGDSVTPIGEIKSAINELIQQSENNGEHANLGSTKSNLQRLFPDFDERNYGYSSMRTFIEEATKFETLQKGTTIYILRSSDHGENVEEQVRRFVQKAAAGTVELGTLGRMIASEFPDFKYKDYGYARLSKYVSSVPGVHIENNLVTAIL